jgi:Skp family chaperone for outer membrane proteins
MHMKKTFFAVGACALLSAALALPLVAQAQNIAIVNGKAVPKARADAFIKMIQAQAAEKGQQLPKKPKSAGWPPHPNTRCRWSRRARRC